MKIDPMFLKHSVRLRVEGFEQQKLLSACLNRKLALRHVVTEDEISMVLTISGADLERFRKLAGNRYRITVLKQTGLHPISRHLFVRGSTVPGLILFALLLFYQSSFVSEINIYGYEKLQESEIRQALREQDLYEGASKAVDLDAVESAMYNRLDNLRWIGIKYIGNLVEVIVAESDETPEKVDESISTHVVAAKAGYIEKIIPKEGSPALPQGSYVKPGDIVILGLLPIEDKTYENRPPSELFRTVHAKGEVWARILYRFTYYQDRYVLIRRETGRNLYGFSLQVGNFKWDSSDFLWPFSSANKEERSVFQTVRPFPLAFGITKVSEVTLSKRMRSDEEIKSTAAMQSRQAAKENIPENAQILNNSLKFSTKENIIEVTIMLHALEEIGKEQPFVFTPTASGIREKGEGQ